VFTQNKHWHGSELVPLEIEEPTVKLLQQTPESTVEFAGADGDVKTLPASEFFTLHREATPDEIVAFQADGGSAKRDAKNAVHPIK
jgi:hypothetical protein